MQTYHDWHIVTFSPWPILNSLIIFTIPLSFVSFFRGIVSSLFIYYIALFLAIFVLFVWFKDVTRESSAEGFHTFAVQLSFNYGMLLFIFSEVMFFFAFFWGFFWLSFAPSIELNLTWPPTDFDNLAFEPFSIPLLNTIILLLSGVTITLAHLFIKDGSLKGAQIYIILTLLLAELFIMVQSFEYFSSSYDISDGGYATTFFLCTGFHGFHVIVGSIFIGVMAYRLFTSNFSRKHHFGFEAAAWYWHFVDVVWLFLFLMVYYWGIDLTQFSVDENVDLILHVHPVSNFVLS
jgi:heme/copper-type cytochrome/quinol oxidase subunit 3